MVQASAGVDRPQSAIAAVHFDGGGEIRWTMTPRPHRNQGAVEIGTEQSNV